MKDKLHRVDVHLARQDIMRIHPSSQIALVTVFHAEVYVAIYFIAENA